MERTKVISVVNNTAKAPKNQGFLEKCFRSGHSFSSAARYDRFDNSPCHICNISLKKTSGKRRELMERTKVISVVNNTAKAPKNQGFLEKCFRSGHSFSSAPRYDRFDTAPCATLPIL